MVVANKNSTLFFELLQVAICTRIRLSKIPSDSEWAEVYKIVVKQSLVGVLFSAIEKLNAEDKACKPGLQLFYQWLGEVAQIEAQNSRLNNAATQLTKIFTNGGLRSCVLKGQGVALLYPRPERRQSGDIDLWIEGNRRQTIGFLKNNNFGIGPVVIHHVEARIIEGVETEIHFMPIWMYNPIYNRRLQKWFKSRQNEQFSHYDSKAGFCYATVEFNVIYCLVHIYHHLLDEGVGLRQVIDYYYILKSYGRGQSDNLSETLRSLGIIKYAGALMWVLKEVCGMSTDLMICQSDVNSGEMLLEEIMATGNMGHFDTRYPKFDSESFYGRNLRKMHRWVKLMWYYPSEVICIPWWKLWHWGWRKRNNRYI